MFYGLWKFSNYRGFVTKALTMAIDASVFFFRLGFGNNGILILLLMMLTIKSV